MGAVVLVLVETSGMPVRSMCWATEEEVVLVFGIDVDFYLMFGPGTSEDVCQ